MRLVLAGLTVVGLCSIASAQKVDTWNIASGLGRVIASEEICGLSYSQQAIEKFIDEKVPADDLNFPGNLTIAIGGNTADLKAMSASQKTANCTQVKRIAKSYGFID
nr:signal recognition particle [Brucella anthropi]